MFSITELPYSYEALEPYIDQETMHIHHDKHHAGYVNNLNDILKDNKNLLNTDIFELLKNVDKVPKDIKTKVINNAGGHANHIIYWNSMSPKKLSPKGEFLNLLNKTFGSLDTFKEKLTQSALARFGSGWAWLVMNNGKLEIMDTANQDSPLSMNMFPLVGLDVWEHAYYLKYQNKRADYVSAWMNVINWEEIEKRFQNNK